ncbi:MAG: HEAT repeat domain-containing protein [bacterium]
MKGLHRFISIILLGLFCSFVLVASEIQIIKPTTKGSTSFAIFVDKKTYEKIQKSVDAYRTSVEQDGLPSYLIVADWQSPEQIKEVILKLAKQPSPLEGVVFVGDIPMPMIRDAQHMTSAFKLDQEQPWLRSSVPSDRYYDDFDLEFTFIKKDSINPLLYHYSLSPESPQRIDRDIYSGRIKPPVEDESKYTLIEKYLLRVAEQKKEKNKLDKAFTFTGHGYHSEALSAWEADLHTLREEFPQFFLRGGEIKNLNHAMSAQMKEIVLTELQDPKLDMALFHAHGADDTQYLIGEPPSVTADNHLQSVKMFLRSKLRTAQRQKRSLEETKNYYIKAYGITADWFEGAFVDSVIKVDSIASSKLDIYISDIDEIAPQARFIMFDECFNGNYTVSPYVTGAYVFGKGKTVAGVANTVNVLQDLWANELLGLLSYGVRVGEWHRTRNFLESHIIGDPTFHYESISIENPSKAIVLQANNAELWKRYLKSSAPILRELAVRMLSRLNGKQYEQQLLSLFKSDPSFIVRMQVLKRMAELRGEAFEQLLFESVNDPYEYIRRLSVMWMGEIGRKDYLPVIAKTILTDPSERVSFNGKDAMELISPKEALATTYPVVDALPASASKEKLKSDFERSFKSRIEWLHKELLPMILSDTVRLKKKISTLRTFRRYNFKEAVPTLIAVARETQNEPVVRVTALEALGWFTFAVDRGLILTACDEILKQPALKEQIKNEAIKTRNRLLTGANNVITP